MAKRLKIPVRCFGSDPDAPSVADLAAWVKKRTGLGGDLTTFYLMRTIQAQKGVDIPAAGGWFYLERCAAGMLPDTTLDDIKDDIGAVISVARNPWWSVPSPASITPDPGEDEVMAYRNLLRNMRDAGVFGHVILTDQAPQPLELELLTGRRFFWYLASVNENSLEKVLEIQRDIAVPPKILPLLHDLMGSYTVRKVIVIDPGEGDLRQALELVDSDNIMSGGFAPANHPTYWEELISGSFLFR